MHLLLDQHGLTKRLSKQQLFAAFIGALIHDFNHPGSTNAHEIKTGSFLALTYSDSSVLERHHLASSFAVMRTKGYDILSGLSPDDYKTVRSTVIELVLSTDLAGHFDSLVKLRALVRHQRTGLRTTRRRRRQRRHRRLSISHQVLRRPRWPPSPAAADAQSRVPTTSTQSLRSRCPPPAA